MMIRSLRHVKLSRTCMRMLTDKTDDFKRKMSEGPDLEHFIHSTQPKAPKFEAKPNWIKGEFPNSDNYERLKRSVKKLKLSTVCQEAHCPNIGECWNGKDGTATATIMIMGDTCTRGCRFCAVKTSRNPPPLDENEPENVSQAIADWGLNYVVLTSVDRDDLDDLGCNHFAKTIFLLKQKNPKLLVEALTPDFQGRDDCITAILQSGLDVFAHNIECVERVTPRVRDRRASYKQSMQVLKTIKQLDNNMVTKTSIMLGLGENDDEIKQTVNEVRALDVDILTLGQYLRPSKNHLPVSHYVTPDKFKEWKTYCDGLGFKYVFSGPMVRSSYKAGEVFLRTFLEGRQKKAVVTPN